MEGHDGTDLLAVALGEGNMRGEPMAVPQGNDLSYEETSRVPISVNELILDKRDDRIRELEALNASNDCEIQRLQEKIDALMTELMTYRTEQARTAKEAFLKLPAANFVLKEVGQDGLNLVLDLVHDLDEAPSGVDWLQVAKDERASRALQQDWSRRFNEAQLKVGGNLTDPSLQPLLEERQRFFIELAERRQITLGVWAEKLPK